MREPNDMPEDARWYINIDHITQRLRSLTGARNDVQMARALGVAQNTIAGWRRRKTIPWDILIRVHHEYGADLNWLLLGQPSIDTLYQYPELINRAGIGWGTGRAFDENMWRWGLNAIYDMPPADLHVVAAREDILNPRREVMIAVPVDDDAMAPAVPEGAVCTCELMPRSVAEDPGYDIGQHHNRLVCLAAGSSTMKGGELLVRRIRKDPASDRILAHADNPGWRSLPLTRGGERLFSLVGEVRAVLTVIPRSGE